MFKLSRIKQSWHRSRFLHAYEAALKSENIHGRGGAAEFALGIVDKLDPWPESVGPKKRAIGKLHEVLGYVYNELAEFDPQHFSSLALEESLKAVTYLTKSDGVDWARAMTNLSLAYGNSLEGNEDDNIAHAIEAAEAALEVLDLDQHRDEWLNATVHLAAYYAHHRRGNMTTNIEESMRLYQAVYDEVTKSGSPLQQARALIGLADGYMKRRMYAKEQNIENAIEVLEQALKLISPETSPRAWATGQNSLAIAYLERINSDKVGDLRRAIEANNKSIAVLAGIDDARERWARAMLLRSKLLENCHDDREENLKLAIEAAQSALSVFSAEKYPNDHANVVQTIDHLRSLRHDDSRAEVLEETIRKYEAVLSSPDSESDPANRGSMFITLGNAYADRVESDHRENMERSIECLAQAVTLFDEHARPLEWGSAVHSLAQSYMERSKGLHADNIEQSIALGERALVVISQLSDPDEHSELLETLGEGFIRRVRGNRRDNLERAIQIFDSAQRRRDRKHNPEAWLRLEQKFLQAEHILRSITTSQQSNGTESSLDVDKYLEGLRASARLVSLKDHPRTWMAAHLFLADTYTRVVPAGVEIDDVIPFGDAFCANCREAVSIYESMLPVADRLGDQDQRALLHQRIGVAYGLMHMLTEVQSDVSADDPEAQRRFAEQARSYYESAIAAHTAALQINSPERSPRNHLKSAVTLGRLHTHEREWDAAEASFASAAGVADRQLCDIELSESDMKDVLSDLGEMATFAPFVSLMLDKPARAIELFEIGRARLLAKALTLESLPLAPVQRDELHAKQREVAIYERRLLSPRLFDRMTPLQKSIRLRRQIRTLVKEINLTDHFSSFTVSAVESLATEGSVVVIPIMSEVGGRIIICFGRNGKSETKVVECQSAAAIRSIHQSGNLKNGGGWQQQYLRHARVGMPDEICAAAGDALGEAFATPLLQALEQLEINPGTHLDILPQGPLGILPLGLARDSRSGQLLLDQYEFSLSPSLTALHHARMRAAIIPASVVTVSNPTGDLTYAQSESHLLRNWFRERFIGFEEGPVSPGQVLDALPQGDVWHFATHGHFDMSAPLKSALALGNGRNLTLETVFETPGLGTPRLVVLSACESGLYDLTSFPSEFIGLPSGFLHAGAAGVIATLWPVADLSTALIMGRFYEGYMGRKLTPSAALRAAQLWLRDATVTDLLQALESWGESGHVASIRKMMDALDQRIRGKDSQLRRAPENSFGSPSVAPFSSPFYWGGFVHYGV